MCMHVHTRACRCSGDPWPNDLYPSLTASPSVSLFQILQLQDAHNPRWGLSGDNGTGWGGRENRTRGGILLSQLTLSQTSRHKGGAVIPIASWNGRVANVVQTLNGTRPAAQMASEKKKSPSSPHWPPTSDWVDYWHSGAKMICW